MSQLTAKILLLMLLSSCANTSSDACPAIRQYSNEQQDQAFNELSRTPPDSILRVYMSDYHNLRAMAEDCRHAN